MWCAPSPLMEQGLRDHHLPPRSSMALSSARLDAVRRAPVLRGRSGRPSSVRRAARRTASSAMSITGAGSELNVFDAIIAKCLFAEAAFQIVNFRVGMKADQDSRLEFRGYCTCHRNSVTLIPKSCQRNAQSAIQALFINLQIFLSISFKNFRYLTW